MGLSYDIQLSQNKTKYLKNIIAIVIYINNNNLLYTKMNHEPKKKI